MKQFLSSKKAQEGTMSLLRKVIIMILLLGVFVFVVLPLITKPLGTDPCLQQNGIRATSCDTEVAARNNFIDIDEADKVCCISIPGKKEDFKLWANSLDKSDDPDKPRHIIQALDAADTYNIDTNHMALIAPPAPGTLVDDFYVTGKSFYPTLVLRNPQQKILDLDVDPTRTFDLVGVNNMADGSCTLVVREAAFFEGDKTYRPKTAANGNLVPPETGFNYKNDNCKQGEGVQITGNLKGLRGDDSYYIATYAVKSEEKTLQVYALIKSQLPDLPEGISAGDPAGNAVQCPKCGTYSTEPACNQESATTSCAGCYWTKKDDCVDCIASRECVRYDAEASCEENPCVDGVKCFWAKKTCYDMKNMNSCEDYPGKTSCNADTACNWRWLKCKDAKTS